MRTRPNRSRRLAILALPAAALVAVIAISASTASPARTGGSNLRVGIFDDGHVLFGVRSTFFPALKQSKAKLLRVTLWWYTQGPIAVAPTRPADATDPADPAYNWEMYDDVVKRATKNGIPVLFSIVGTPPWANKGKGWNVAPTNAAELEAFATAAARRYDGTFTNDDGVRLGRVALWTAWNEPNSPVFLRPQFARDAREPSGWAIQSARDYARICNAVVAGVKDAQRTAKVGCGVTAPRGNNNPSSSRPSVSPLAFARAMAKAGATGFDAYAHHPYPGAPTETPTTPPPSVNGRAPTAVTMGNLDTLVSEVTRLFGPKRIWLTEYGYQTNPTDTVAGVPWKKQAQYLQQAVAIARANPRIDLFVWFLLIDETRNDGWQSGLIGSDLVKKPAYRAFQNAVS
ncbi:MAG: DUF5722 domain-containing protein [Gaiellales bacterium]